MTTKISLRVEVSKDVIQTLSMLGALNSPIRISVMLALGKNNPMRVETLWQRCCPGVTKGALSQHLAILRRAGLVTCRTKGQERWYEVSNYFALDILHTCLRHSEKGEQDAEQ